jgi:hypothetical protein
MMSKENTKGTGFDEEEGTNSSDLQRGKNYVLAIAIDEYSDSQLYNCVKDMEVVTKELQRYHGFDSGDITTMPNGKANRGAVIREIRNLSNKLTEKDNFILYFSGHGIIDKIDKEGYWLVSGCDFNNYSTEGITNQDILRYVRTMKARHILLLVDSCFSGSLFYTTKSGSDPTYPVDVRERFPSRWAITAGRQEKVSDGEAGEHSPFAEKLISFLQRGDHTEGRFSVSELAGFLKTSVPRNANQYPDGRPLQNAGDDGGEFVFYLKGRGAPPPIFTITPVTSVNNKDAGLESLAIETVLVQETPDHTALYTEIRNLVSKSNLEMALQKLVATNSDAIQLLQTYNAAKRENMMGLLTHDEWFRKRNQVSYNILEMIK